jgi:hypothetical protein
LAVIWLQKQPAEAERNLFAKGQCCRPHPAVPRTGPHGLPTRSSAEFGETDRENLACCPDFKLSHYLLGDFVVAPMPDALPLLIGSARRGTERRRDGGLRVTVIISAVPSGGELTG